MTLRKAPSASADARRITAQFRTARGMAYELREHGARLAIQITPRGGDSVGWHVEASSADVPGVAISEAASTRSEAVRRTGAQWAVDERARGLPTFDWDAVARALREVRAI